jgi:hypothetical protein
MEIEEFGTIEAESDKLLTLCFQSHPAFQQALEAEDRHFLILGRKGSGKSAIYQEILELGRRQHDIFSAGHSFAEYPWHYHGKMAVLYVAERERYLHSWQYFILLSLAKILLNEDNSQPWSEEARETYANLESFVKDTYGSTNPRITEIFTPGKRLSHLSKFGLDLGAKVEVDLSTQNLPSLFQEVNRSLERSVMTSLNPKHRYYLCFDDLDTDFKAEAEYEQRLIGLILAARKFVNAAREYGRSLKVLVFLRSDIYHKSLSFNDKNKITDTYSLEIEWDRSNRGSTLKSLMERRFAELLETGPEGAWQQVFDETGNMGRFPTKYHFLRDHTFCRPRDIIKFCNCILDVYQRQRSRAENGSFSQRFTSDAIYAARPDYSQYFRREITDEIRDHHPDHKIYFEILQQIEVQVFHRGQFLEACDKWKDRLTENRRPDEILEFLYEFSAVGFARPPLVSDPNSAEYNYSYMDADSIFNRSADWFCVHWGLVENLKLRRHSLDPGLNGKPNARGEKGFESQYNDIAGGINVISIIDPLSPVETAAIPSNVDWIARVDWEIHGPLVTLITGAWKVSVFLESIGPGGEGGGTPAIVPVESGLLFSGPPPQRTYQKDIVIPAGAFPPGAYKMVTTITHEVREGVPTSMAAFQEGPVLQIFQL